MTGSARRACVLGGGVAGLAAAFGLADRGFAVTLLESHGWLGGRAFAAPDRVLGRAVDNGPHVMLGCYRAMRRLVTRLGTADRFRQDRRLAMAYRTAQGRASRLQLAALPVPIAMPFALLRLGIGVGARGRALWGMGGALWRVPATWTVADWLRRRRQLGEPDAWLWRPLCRAIMNVEPELAAARGFLATLREAFSGSAAAAAFWVPLQPWSAILGEPAAPALAAAGVTVRCGARVVAVEAGEGHVGALQLGDGERLAIGRGDLVVSALPWRSFRAVFGGALPLGDLGDLGDLASSPIVSAYFATAPGRAPLPDEGAVTALVDGDPFHFVVRTPGAPVAEFALLAGGNRAFDGMSVAAIEAAARAQLARHYPEFAADTLAAVRIRKEQHATFVAGPGTEARRPAPGPLPGGPANLLVCGDWTATGLPATLEGAARSAEAMLARLPGR